MTTFKRDGTPKATPVWITGYDGSYLFYTGVDAWKTTGELLADETSIARAKQAIADKYGWQAALARAADWTRARVGRGNVPIAVALTLVAPD